MEISLRRRTLLAAGLSASFLSLIPDICLGQDLSNEERSPLAVGAPAGEPYQATILGSLPKVDVDEICSFVTAAIGAWRFNEMGNYVSGVPGLLELKTNQEKCPSYLAEYKSAAQLLRSARQRFGSMDMAFPHLLFERRDDAAIGADTRIGRCRTFCLDELVRHIVANGGFRSFGLINYGGRINLSFYDQNSYRRNP